MGHVDPYLLEIRLDRIDEQLKFMQASTVAYNKRVHILLKYMFATVTDFDVKTHQERLDWLKKAIEESEKGFEKSLNRDGYFTNTQVSNE